VFYTNSENKKYFLFFAGKFNSHLHKKGQHVHHLSDHDLKMAEYQSKFIARNRIVSLFFGGGGVYKLSFKTVVSSENLYIEFLNNNSTGTQMFFWQKKCDS
jgi:hypothetical protein